MIGTCIPVALLQIFFKLSSFSFSFSFSGKCFTAFKTFLRALYEGEKSQFHHTILIKNLLYQWIDFKAELFFSALGFWIGKFSIRQKTDDGKIHQYSISKVFAHFHPKINFLNRNNLDFHSANVSYCWIVYSSDSKYLPQFTRIKINHIDENMQ